MHRRIHVRLALFTALLGACDGAGPTDSDVDNVTPVCDGRKQDGEDTVDAPFDADGDGFFDADNPDCVATFQPNQLDCDDTNPNVNPAQLELPCNGVDDDCREASPESPDSDSDGVGACEDCNDQDPRVAPGREEVCFDDLDNDCDGTVDNDCGEDYNGTWVLAEPIVFECGIQFPPINLVTLNMPDFFVLWNPPLMTVGQTVSATPPPLEGSVESDGSVALHVREGSAPDCVRNWNFDGTFIDDRTFEGTLTMDINAFIPLICGSCPLMPRVYHVNATKVP